jgi:hypothetical protein
VRWQQVGSYLDRVATQWNTTRSGAVAELLRQVEQKELEKELTKGYAAWAKSNQKDAEVFLAAQSGVILSGD